MVRASTARIVASSTSRARPGDAARSRSRRRTMKTSRSTSHPAARSSGARRSPTSGRSTNARRCGRSAYRASSAAIRPSASVSASTNSWLSTHTRGSSSWKNASPSAWRADRSAAPRRTRRSKSSARANACASVVFVVLVLVAGAADHDLVLLDRDGHRPVAGPVLGVDRVVLHGGVEPQAVALLAVVEGALELGHRALAAPRASAATPTPALLGLLALLALVGLLGLLGLAARLLLGARGLGGLELGGDQRVVLGPQVDLVVEVRPRRNAGRKRALAVLLGGEVELPLERLDLLDGDLELVRDPRVGAALADPTANLVEVRSQ